MPVNKVTIYTDGGCTRDADHHGGWSAILLCEDTDGTLRERELAGYEPRTTNNRMEIKAVLEALRVLKWPCHVTIYSDSTYVVNSIGTWRSGHASPQTTCWLKSWRHRGWVRHDGELKNVDLWKLIWVELTRHHSVSVNWLRGHAGHQYNERCDALATAAIENGKTAPTISSTINEPQPPADDRCNNTTTSSA